MSDLDQAQGSEGTESTPDAGTEQSAPSEVDNQETQNQTQSNEGESGEEQSPSKVYKTPDGRELSPDEMYDEYNKLYPEFTRRSQKLKRLEEKEKQWEQESRKVAEESIEEDEILKNVDPKVKTAIQKITEPLIQQRLKERDQQRAQQQREQQFDQELSRLEEKYPGGKGLPKFDRNEVLEAMRQDGNRIFDPEAKFKELHSQELIDYMIKQALKKKQGKPKTERTGSGSETRKPERTAPSNWEEAGKSLLQKLKR